MHEQPNLTGAVSKCWKLSFKHGRSHQVCFWIKRNELFFVSVSYMCNVHCVVGDAVCSHEQVMKGVVRQGTKTRCGTHDGATQEELGRGGGVQKMEVWMERCRLRLRAEGESKRNF